MGGGGGILGPSDPRRLRDRLREAERGARDAKFETEVSGLIGQTLAAYNSRDVDGPREMLDTVRRELGDEVEGAVELLFGGSVAKHTYVNGLSDVDALVLLDREEVVAEPPSVLRSVFTECLRARFGRNSVREGVLAVTLMHGDKSIQLLPAIREGAGFKIASSDGAHWSKIDPERFAEELTKANQNMDGKLVPTVKLAKGILAGLPEQRRLTGYHTEALAVQAFQDYEGTRTPKAMLAHFFDQAPTLVSQPIRDSTGQSTYVDEYLGEPGSVRRQVVADALGRVARRIRNADGAQSVPRWRDLLGGP